MLSVIGIFSVMAYSVSVLTHEIGIRMALGAQRSAVMILVLKRGMKLVGAGILAGFLVVIAIVPVLRSQLWGVSSLDLFTIAACISVLLLAGLFASYAPALRATRVDTNTALRCE